MTHRHTVTVPAHVLQDLLGNAFLMSLGQANEEFVTEQIDALQECLTEQVGDMDTVYGREPKPAIEVSFTGRPMGEIINFPKR